MTQQATPGIQGQLALAGAEFDAAHATPAPASRRETSNIIIVTRTINLLRFVV